MQIWIIVEEQEYGPYERDEVFHLLNTGEVTDETLARVDGADEVLLLKDALKQRCGLFNFDQILAKEAEMHAPSASPPPSDEAAEESLEAEPGSELESAPSGPRWLRTMPAWVPLAAGLTLLLGGSLLFWNLHRPKPVTPQPAGALVVQAVEAQGPIESAPAQDNLAPERKELLLSSQQAIEAPMTASAPVDVAATPSSPEVSAAPSPQWQDGGGAPPGASGGEAPPLRTAQQDADTARTLSPMQIASPVRTGTPSNATPPSSAPKAALAPMAATRNPDVLSADELMTILAERFAAQPVKVFADEDPWGQERKTTFSGSFELDTPLEWNPKVKVQYRVPMTVRKHPTPEASNMVVLCTWMGAADPPIPGPPPPLKPGELPKALLQDSLKQYSDGLGFSAFSLEIVTNRKDLGNEREAYFYAGPEWVDIVRRAQGEIVKRHGLRKKKLLISGASMGGTFAEGLAVAMPDEVAGVTIQNAPNVKLPVTRSNTAWFVGVTRGDGGKQANLELVKTLRTLGTPCVHAITPPAYKKRGERGDAAFYHSVGPEASRAARLFLQAVAERQDPKGENDPASWPYVRDTAKPLLIRRNDRQAIEQIPPSRREYMPSRDFVHVLQGMPVSMQTVAMDARDPSRSQCMVGLPPLSKPKGLIVLTHKYQYTDLGKLLNNINFLSGQGYLVLAPRMRGSSEAVLQTTLDFLGKNRLLASMPSSFIGVGLENEPLWKLLLAQRGIKPAVHVPIDFAAGQLLDPSKWPVGARIDWPVLFLYDEREFKKVKTAAEAKQVAAKLEGVKTFVDALQRRNQVAAVRFIPAETKSAEEGAQKAIETALEFIDASMAGRIRTQFR